MGGTDVFLEQLNLLSLVEQTPISNSENRLEGVEGFRGIFLQILGFE